MLGTVMTKNFFENFKTPDVGWDKLFVCKTKTGLIFNFKKGPQPNDFFAVHFLAIFFQL